MRKFWLLLSAACAVLNTGAAAAESNLPAYGDLYNVQWCPCNPEEPFDENGSVVMGKTVMCPCEGMYSGYKKGFEEDMRDISRGISNQVRKLNYFKYYLGMDYNIASPKAGGGNLSFDDIHFANPPISVSPKNIIGEQDNLAFVLGARMNKYFGLEAFYEQTYEDNTVNQLDHTTLNAGSNAYYMMNEYTTNYSAYGLDLIGYIPVSAYFDFVGSLGIAQYRFKNEANFAIYRFDGTDLEDVVSDNFNENKIGWRAAIGAQLNIADGVALRGMYRYISVGGKMVDKMDEFSIGVRFLF